MTLPIGGDDAENPRLALLQGHAGAAVWDMPVPAAGRVDPAGPASWSPGFARVLGYPPGQRLAGRVDNLARLLHPDDRSATLEALGEYMRSGEGGFAAECRLRCHDGYYRWFRLTADAQHDADGRVSWIGGALTDIHELVASRRALARADGLRSLNRFHDHAARLANAVARMRLDGLDEGVLNCLRILGSYLEADRAYLFRVDTAQKAWVVTHEWCAEGIVPRPCKPRDMPFGLFPGLCDSLRQGQGMAIGGAGDLARLSPAAQAYLEAQSVHAMLIHPVCADGELLGFVGFDDTRRERQFSDTDRALLALAAENLSALMMRHRHYQREQEARRALERVNHQLVEALAEVERLARHDALTGLFNRGWLDQALKAEARRFRRAPYPLSVILIDIDHFKQINDTRGHDAGDRVLIAIAAALRREVRGGDSAGRWGGEEFLVIAPDTPRDAALQLAERLRAAIAGLRLACPATASFGVAELQAGESISRLLIRADRALYRAKQEGRDRVCGAPPDAGTDGIRARQGRVSDAN
ncbi:sensor domain-containing diguanylate cyclase [Thauera sinica]|uniref:diguanylate cyclase n=1 Tax=Thauera sinica TaxID=2665146 RepID=A0ABW1AUS5_9RHOO|nr:diguanylate cyclase [Thauera sp. K11]